ncbi:MAG TPA: hypothetical protein DDW30_04050 [Clostridiales bacterium]|nr:hypothetical protein [Clostridiales bacterium]
MKEQLIIYPEFDERIERDNLYTVSVTQGERTEHLPVYNHTEDSRVNRNPLDGRRADEFRRFSTFAFAGEGVRVDVRVGCDFRSYEVMPARKHFRHSFRDGVISVYLDRPDYVVIRLDGGDHTDLAILADAPEAELPREGEKTIVVDRWQEVEGGVLTLTEPHTTVYIPAGAVLNARIQVLADDCRIIGRGAIVDPVGDIYRYSAAELDTGGVILIKSVNRTLVDGVHLLDAKAFNLEVIGTWAEVWATDNLVRNVKILSTQMSSDGITFCYYARNSRAEHCFVYCGDNALVYEDYAHYRDVTVGTTCNALYPQTDVEGSSAEDIYVFRADEGLINVTMGGENGITRSQDHTIRNFSAVDITFTPYFLFVELPKSNPAVTIGEGLTVENVWLRKLSDTRTCDFYRNIAAGDYKITLKNCSVDGKLLREITPETTGGAVVPAGHSFRCLSDADFDPCIPSARETVDYKNQLNVYIGHWQIFFPAPVRYEGIEIFLPAETLRRELRTDCMAETVLRDGVAYVGLSDLTRSGMAKSIDMIRNRLLLTPNDPCGNLLPPDSGIVSKYTEYICYASHLVALREDGETVLRVINTFHHKSVGLFRLIGEEVRKYGAGTYRLDFEVRSPEEKPIRAAIDYSNRAAAEQCFPLTADWSARSLEVTVDEADLDEPKIAIIISGNGDCAVEEFDVRCLSLTKID